METDSPICAGDGRVNGDCGHCVARRISLCSHVDDEGIARLQVLARRRTVAKGRAIFEQEGALLEVFIITAGIIKLFRMLPDGQRQITGFLGPGDILGSIKIQGGAHCTAEAVTDVSVCGFDRDRLRELLIAYPSLCFGLLITATDEIEAQHDQITLLARKRAGERVAAFLLAVGQRWNSEFEGKTAIPLPIARVDIADYLGLTVESVSRTFQQFRAQGYIDLPRPSLVVLRNPAALYALSGYDELPVARVTMGL